MDANETEIIALMESVRARYFPELQISSFEVVHDEGFDGVMGRAVFGRDAKVILHYGDKRVVEPKYRMGLVPVIAHELAHYMDPVDPERVMRERLPPEMMILWEELLENGYAKCSMERTTDSERVDTTSLSKEVGNKMSNSVAEHLARCLKDPEFSAEYHALDAEFAAEGQRIANGGCVKCDYMV